MGLVVAITTIAVAAYAGIRRCQSLKIEQMRCDVVGCVAKGDVNCFIGGGGHREDDSKQ